MGDSAREEECGVGYIPRAPSAATEEIVRVVQSHEGHDQAA
jgi:hypothetical protein